MENNNEIKKENEGGLKVKILSFKVGYEAPENKYDKSKGYLKWGKKDDYPDKVVAYYNDGGSPTHKSAIDKKIRFACGNGFKKIKDSRLQELVDKFMMESVVTEAFTSYEILNGFAFEIVWDRAGENWTSFKAIPVHKIRIGIEGEDFANPHFLFSNNWKLAFKKEMFRPEIIPAYDPENRTGKQLIYFADFNIANDELYPIVTYGNSFNFIDIEAEYGRFHFNSLAHGYAPDFLLNIATGIPGEEEQDKFFEEFHEQMSNRGSAQKIIITYSDGQDSKSELTTIQQNNSDQKFQMPLQSSVEMIARGHSIPPQLVIMSNGLFGQDRQDIMQEFQDDYVSARQKKMENILNKLIADLGITEKLELLTYRGESEEEIQPDAVDANAQAQAALRGSVGGVQALLQVQQSVAQGLTDIESAIAIVELIYGFDRESALRLVGSPSDSSTSDTTTQLNKE